MSTHELRLTRDFNAPRDVLFDAWTTAEKLALWFGPPGVTVDEAEADPRPGGRYRIKMTGMEDQVHEVTGVYSEVKPPEQLAFTWAWTQEDGSRGAETTVDVTFESLGDGTRVTILHRGFTETAQRDHHAQGWTGCLEGLEGALKKVSVAG
ncbi:MAG: SRPBCC domain-containing protein [Maricaulaceae bacterium]|jgi:uncharacterized protein YndB with AHSA1/START domain